MPILSIHIRSFYLKHSFKMPTHAKEYVDFIKMFCICCFRKGKDLRPINNAEKVFLNLNKRKETTQTLSKLYSGKIIQQITQTFLPCFAQNLEKSLQGLTLTSYSYYTYAIKFRPEYQSHQREMKKILAPMLECVSGKLVYQGAEDVSKKPSERLICQDCYA